MGSLLRLWLLGTLGATRLPRVWGQWEAPQATQGLGALLGA